MVLSVHATREATVLVESKPQITTSKCMTVSMKTTKVTKKLSYYTNPFGEASSTYGLFGVPLANLKLGDLLAQSPLLLSSSSFTFLRYSLLEPSLEKECLLFDALFESLFCSKGRKVRWCCTRINAVIPATCRPLMPSPLLDQIGAEANYLQ